MKRDPRRDRNREHRVHRHAGAHDDHASPKRFALEPAILRHGLGPERNHRVWIVARIILLSRGPFLGSSLEKRRLGVVAGRHADVAAERQPREDVLRFTPAPAEDRRTETDGKPRRVNAESLGRDEVPELVNEDHEAEDQQRCEYRLNYVT